MPGNDAPITLADLAEVVMGQSPEGEHCNTDGRGDPLLNGPTEFGSYHPLPRQFTTDSRKRAEIGDLLFCVRGSTTGRMNWADQPYAIGRGLAAIRPKDGASHRHFVRAVVERGLPALLGQATGSTFPSVSGEQIRSIPCPNLPRSDRLVISQVLGALDDKIDLNRRMCQTLEEMARALFDNWETGLASTCIEQKVQVLIDEGVLVIGDGYRAKNSELAKVGLPFVRAGDLRLDGVDLEGAERLSPNSAQIAGNKVNQLGDVAFTSKGTVGRVTRVSAESGTFVYSPQVCFWRSTDPMRLNPHVLYRWMKSSSFTRQLAAVSAQTDMAPYVSLRDQKSMKVRLPTPRDQAALGARLAPIDERLAHAARESRTLAALRDTLLPKLISGELRVPASLGSMQEVAT